MHDRQSKMECLNKLQFIIIIIIITRNAFMPQNMSLLLFDSDLSKSRLAQVAQSMVSANYNRKV